MTDGWTCLPSHEGGSKSCLPQGLAFLFLFSSSYSSLATVLLQSNTFIFTVSSLLLTVMIHVSLSILYLGVAVCMVDLDLRMCEGAASSIP